MQPSQKYKALIQARADLVKKAEGILAKESPSAEELAEAQAITGTKEKPGQLAALDAQLEQHEILQEAERRAPAASTALIEVTPRAERDPKRGFRDMADFAASVRKAIQGRSIDPRLALVSGMEKAGLEVGAAPTGFMEEAGTAGEGYLVPVEMREEIWKLILAPEGLLDFLQPEPTGSNAVSFTKDETTPWGSAGVQAKWVDAGEQLTVSKHAHKATLNQLFRLAAYVLATDELEEDAPNLANKLTVGAAAAINWVAEEAAMYGDGVGKPKGWMATGSPLVTVTKEGAQAAATIVTGNVTKMYSRCLNPELAMWLASKETLPQLMAMSIGNQPIWTPPNAGLREAPGGFLLGRPVRFSRHCQVLGTVGDIQLIDPTGYQLNIKTGGLKYASSIHLFFDYAVNAYRWMFRIGGQPILSAAVSPAKGSATESHFVTVETRA